MARLFLICPECFSEPDISDGSDDDTYFLTALGATFDDDPQSFLANLEFLLNSMPIAEICIYQSTACDFINQPFGEGRESIGLSPESAFSATYRSINERTVVPLSTTDRRLEMAQNNLRRQLHFVSQALKEKPSESSEPIALTGIIYGAGESFIERERLQEICISDT